MGQGHSTVAGHTPPTVVYHPSAVGYTMEPQKAAHSNTPQSNEDGGGGGESSSTSIMRRSRIGPMRNRAKGKRPPVTASAQAPSRSPRSPELSTTLTAFPDVPASPLKSDNRARAASLPSKLSSTSAVRPVHARTIFEDNSSTGDIVEPPRDEVTKAHSSPSAVPSENSPASLTPPGSGQSPGQSPSPRGEYRVSAQPTHPSIIEVPELETADATLTVRRRQSNETIRTPSRMSATANGIQQGRLQVPGQEDSSPRTAQIRRQEAKRASNGTDTSESPSLAPSTATGKARRAADESNRETLLAYWQTAEQVGGESTDSHVPAQRQHRLRHSWASSRSGGEARNTSPYRPVSGRWTSHWEDHRGLGITHSSTSFETADEVQTQEMISVEPRLTEEEHQNTQPTTSVQTMMAPVSPPHGDSTERPKRKPVPEHEYGPSPPSPIHLLARLSKRLSEPESEGTTSKRTSDQSHLSAVTGALHQHVERLRAGPTYQIDENASHLFEQQSTTPRSSSPPPSSIPVAQVPPLSPSSYKRGRALSLSLMNKLKNRTRKTSDASLLSTGVFTSSGSRVEPSSPSKSNVFSLLPSAQAPTLKHRRGSELTLQAVQAATHGNTTNTQSFAAPQAQHGLYITARRPSRKAVPTTAASDTSVLSRLASAPASSMQQRSASKVAGARLSPRPASIASRRSSRSKHSSNASLRTAAAAAAANKAQAGVGIKSSTGFVSAPSSTSASTSWWNPWSRKGSLSGLPFATKLQQPPSPQAAADDEAGWIDEAEDDSGLVSPIAEDPRNIAERQQQGPEKVQQPWTPAWANRVVHSQGQNAAAADTDASVHEQIANTSRRGSAAAPEADLHRPSAIAAHGSSPHLLYNAPPPIASSSSSSFTSLAPPPAPAPVPPPRKQRRRSRNDTAGLTPLSSSPTSPLIGSSEDVPQAANSATDERRPSLLPHHKDVIGATSDITMEGSPARKLLSTAVYSGPPSVSNTEARESLLSDDLDYAPSGVLDDQSSSATADEMDSEATMQLYRSSLLDARRPRGGAPHVNLSPVREIMTPESRPLSSDDRSGARSAASTLDASTMQHRRINSGASMALVAMSPVVGETAVPERRPIPAKPVVAEPHTDMASVHRSSSPVGSSTHSPSTVGGPTSVSSMKKHTGQSPPEALLAATAVLANRRRNTEAVESRMRSLSSPPEPQSQSMLSGTNSRPPHATSPPPIHRLTLSHAEADAQREKRVRESWRSTDGPWSARVMTGAVTMPAARGITRASVRPVARHERSGSAPMLATDDSREQYPPAADLTETSIIVHPEQRDEDDTTDAVPFAETAVQASLAALQALEMSEEAQAGGDWRARWASEKLLGFSSSHLAPPNMVQRLPALDHEEAADDHSDYSGARFRRRAEPYPRGSRAERSTSSVDLQSSRRKQAHAKRLDITSSSASLLYDSSMAGGGADGLTSDSEQTSRRRHRRRRKREKARKVSEGREAHETQPISMRHTSAPRVSVTAAEWDETIVPAHAKRLELEASEELRLSKDYNGGVEVMPSFLASGVVVPASPSLLSDDAKDIVDAAVQPRSRAAQYDDSLTTSQHRRQRLSKPSDKRRDASGTTAAKENGEGSKLYTRRHRQASTTAHGQYPSTSAVSLAKSTRSSSSSSTRKGYGCDDIVAWQASLHIAALPSVAEG